MCIRSTRSSVSEHGAVLFVRWIIVHADVGLSITGFFYFLSAIRMYLLYTRMHVSMGLTTKIRVINIIALVLGIIGSIGVALLSILNDLSYPNEHLDLLVFY